MRLIRIRFAQPFHGELIVSRLQMAPALGLGRGPWDIFAKYSPATRRGSPCSQVNLSLTWGSRGIAHDSAARGQMKAATDWTCQYGAYKARGAPVETKITQRRRYRPLRGPHKSNSIR